MSGLGMAALSSSDEESGASFRHKMAEEAEGAEAEADEVGFTFSTPMRASSPKINDDDIFSSSLMQEEGNITFRSGGRRGGGGRSNGNHHQSSSKAPSSALASTVTTPKYQKYQFEQAEVSSDEEHGMSFRHEVQGYGEEEASMLGHSRLTTHHPAAPATPSAAAAAAIPLSDEEDEEDGGSLRHLVSREAPVPSPRSHAPQRGGVGAVLAHPSPLGLGGGELLFTPPRSARQARLSSRDEPELSPRSQHKALPHQQQQQQQNEEEEEEEEEAFSFRHRLAEEEKETTSTRPTARSAKPFLADTPRPRSLLLLGATTTDVDTDRVSSPSPSPPLPLLRGRAAAAAAAMEEDEQDDPLDASTENFASAVLAASMMDSFDAILAHDSGVRSPPKMLRNPFEGDDNATRTSPSLSPSPVALRAPGTSPLAQRRTSRPGVGEEGNPDRARVLVLDTSTDIDVDELPESLPPALQASQRLPIPTHVISSLSPAKELPLSPPRSLTVDPSSFSPVIHDVEDRVDTCMPSVNVREDLHQNAPPPSAASVSLASTHLARQVSDGEREGSSEQVCAIFVNGRKGHAHCINGGYVLMQGISHDGRPVYRHERPIPAGFSDASGKFLHIYYHSDNDAWAISTETGSLDVLAYVMGDVLDKNSSLVHDAAVWNVSNGAGEYEPDPTVRLSGPAVPHSPPKMLTSHSKVDMPEMRPPPEEEDEEDGAYSSQEEGGAEDAHHSAMAATHSMPFPDESDDGASSSASASSPKMKKDGKSKQSFRKRMSQKLKNGAKSLKNLPGAKGLGKAMKDTKARLQRLGGGETPVEAMRRHMEKFKHAEQEPDKAAVVYDLQKAVRRGRSTKDTVEDLRVALLDVWRLLLRNVDLVGVEYREVYFDTIIAVMVREEIQIHSVTAQTQGEDWLQKCTHLLIRTHMYVVDKLSSIGMYESLLLFCAKALAINYFCVPKLADIIVKAVVKATPVEGRRAKKIGENVAARAVEAQATFAKTVPLDKRVLFNSIHRVAQVTVNATLKKPASAFLHSYCGPQGQVITPAETLALMDSWHHETLSPNLLDPSLWPTEATDGPWTQRFVSSSEAGFGFLSIFLEVLFRRCRALYLYTYYKNKTDQRLGINERTVIGTIFVPGFIELTTCFLRLALTSEQALKQTFRVGYGPPSVVCNWTDRTAACVLALSQNGLFFTCMIEDLMNQTSTSHVADVMAFLGSLKALLESYDRMHESCLVSEVDINLILKFLRLLLECRHYVVIMFTLRWVYDCLDFFWPEHRAQITHMLFTSDIFGRVFCHWEPSVRHLMHMILIYRFYETSCMRQQATFLQLLGQQLAVTPHEQDGLKQMDSRIFEESNSLLSVIALQREQTSAVQTFLWDVAEAHDVNTPPYTPANLLPWVTPEHPERNLGNVPLERSRYASMSIEQLRKSLQEGIQWVKHHRFESAADELYPPLTLSLPPLQNMTSLYAPQSKGSKGDKMDKV